VRFPPFLLPLVRACSHTSSECPSEFSASALHCFILKNPKGSRFSVVKCFHRPTCLTFRLPPLALACFILRKLPGYPPPLFQLVAGCFALRFRCEVILLLFIFTLLSFPFFSSCFDVAVSFYPLSWCLFPSHTVPIGAMSFSKVLWSPDIVQGRRLKNFLNQKNFLYRFFNSPLYFHFVLNCACLLSSLTLPRGHHDH
jgi:hypothetical protein